MTPPLVVMRAQDCPPPRGEAAQTVFAVAELRIMIMEYLVDKDTPLAHVARDLVNLRLLNKAWYHWTRKFIHKDFIQDLLFCRPTKRGLDSALHYMSDDDIRGILGLRYVGHSEEDDGAEEDDSPEEDDGPEDQCEQEENFEGWLLHTTFEEAGHPAMICKVQIRLNPVLKDVLPHTWLLEHLHTDYKVKNALIINPDDICYHGDNECNLEVKWRIAMTRLGVQPRHFKIPEPRLRLVDLIPSRHLFLCQPPVKKLAVRLFTVSPGSNNFSIGCSYRLILSCENGVKVGHLLIALAKHHGAMRFGKQDAGYVFDDGYVVMLTWMMKKNSSLVPNSA